MAVGGAICECEADLGAGSPVKSESGCLPGESRHKPNRPVGWSAEHIFTPDRPTGLFGTEHMTGSLPPGGDRIVQGLRVSWGIRLTFQ